jgi:hypothetical protein
MGSIDFSDLGSVLEKTLKGKEFSYETKYNGEVRDIVSEVFIINSISWGSIQYLGVMRYLENQYKHLKEL